MLDQARFLRPYGFRVVAADKRKCMLELPHKPALERPGGIINGPALMAAADCAMWLAIKVRLGVEGDALTSELNSAFLARPRASTSTAPRASSRWGGGASTASPNATARTAPSSATTR